MEQNPYTVLFIDDNCKNYIATLEIAAKASGFELFAADNVLEGLEFLSSYAQTIDAIILDLSFPKGEMQGKEALQRIKALYGQLPVIMLTDSDTAQDIEMVVECMKKGAYNYVGKRTLNPVYLFQVVHGAVQQYHSLLRITAKTVVTEKVNEFYTIMKPCTYGRFTNSAVFGFELASVNKPGSETETAIMKSKVVAWHENLLKTLSIGYRDEIQLNLKYIASKQKIKCCILITTYGVDEMELEPILRNIQHDLKPFFSSAMESKSNPYLFEEITDEKFLNSANEFPSQYKYNVFYRKPLKQNAQRSIGFTNTTETENTTGYNPDELFPSPSPVYFDNELFRALLNQKEYAEIDVQIIPKQLLKSEIDFIRQVIKNPFSLDTLNLTQEEIKFLPAYLQKFLTSTNDKFLVSVVLKRGGSTWEQHLKSAVQNYFFGFQTNIGYQLRKPATLFRFCTSEKGTPNQLPFFYSVTDALQVFRLPVSGLSDLPGIQEQSHIFHNLPDNLPQEGILMGEKKTVGGNTEIRIGKDALARHVYIMGQTGTGKSTLLKSMIADCLNKNEGFTVIDPHGDLYDEVLKMIPKNKRKKVSIINTSDPANSVALNPLNYDANSPQAKSLVINEIIRAFSSLYDMKQAGGPMFETYFKNGLLLVMDEKVQEKFGKGTLADMGQVFYNDDYRKKLLAECGSASVKDFFKAAQATSGDQVFSNFAIYITSKLTRFVEDFYLAPILVSKKKNVDFRRLMDEGNILLVKMDKGLIGADNTSLLGQILLSNIFLAGMSRTDLDVADRKPYYIFIDEFQNFVKGDAGNALSEVRKYGLNLILANQTLGQLDDYLVQSLLGNVGSLVFFRPGINDYEKIRHYLEPEFRREDVLKLPNFNCIARLLIDNIPTEPFTFQTKIM